MASPRIISAIVPGSGTEIACCVTPADCNGAPLAFAPVTQARFGTAGFNTMRGPGVRNFDFSLFRQFRFSERWTMQFRAEVFNLTNTPHFSNPASNVSNLQLNADGTIRNLGGFSTITSIRNTGREGLDERVFRFGLRFAF